jgi:DNA polymerase-3 subunit delta
MQIRSEQLPSNLARKLEPSYLIAGAEPLLVIEAAAQVRAAARAAGAADREVFDIGPHFDWADFRNAAQSMGLFAQRRILELRFVGGKHNNDSLESLRDYCARPDLEAVLLVTWPEWSKAVEKAAWVQPLAALGAVVPIWPVRAHELPRWLQTRGSSRGVRLSTDAATRLAERVEGNLLAAAQAIDLLSLLAGGRTLDPASIDDLIADSARFDIFQLADAALNGDAPRAVRVLRALRAEDADIFPAFSWMLTQIEQVRALASLVDSGMPAATACAKTGIRDWNQQPFLRALQRGNSRVWELRLIEAAHIDLAIKGRANGSPWVLLERWLLRCSLAPQLAAGFAA